MCFANDQQRREKASYASATTTGAGGCSAVGRERDPELSMLMW
jgi:hypothetical protein